VAIYYSKNLLKIKPFGRKSEIDLWASFSFQEGKKLVS
jgi:hypothetical protein